MSEGPPKKNHVWPPGPQGKRVHAHEVLGLKDEDKHNVDKIKSAARRLSKRYHPDVQGGSEDHIKVVNQATIEAVARAEGRWDERDGVARPKETVASLEAAETALKAQLAAERRRSTPDQARIQLHQSELRAVQGRKRLLKETEARAAAAEEQAYQERVEAGKREREAAEAAEERARQERVAAAEQNNAQAESIDPASKIEPTEAETSEQSGAADQTSEKNTAGTGDTQPKEEEEPVVTGSSVVPYVERDSEVVPQGEVVDHPIEPPGTEVARTMGAPEGEEEVPREPGMAVVVARESSSTDVVPVDAERPAESGAVVPYEEDEYFPLAAAGGGGGEGGGGDDEDAAHDHPEGHDPHPAHAHDAHHHGHGDHAHEHGDHKHDNHDAHGGKHSDEKKKGWGGVLWGFFTSLFAFPGETIKGFGTFFGKGGGGGGGGGESHGHH